MKNSNTSIRTSIVLMLTFTCSAVLAASDAYMTINADVVGNINGEVDVAGFEDTIEVFEMHHLFTRTSDTTEHKPLIVTVPMDKSTPLLMHVLDQELNIIDMNIKFIRPDSNTGQPDHFYTYTITGAKLVAAEPVMYDNNLPENFNLRTAVRLRFTYQEITHTFENEGITHTLAVNP